MPRQFTDNKENESGERHPYQYSFLDMALNKKKIINRTVIVSNIVSAAITTKKEIQHAKMDNELI